MNTGIKDCQNCHLKFTIEPDDFAFYEKVTVPPPTFCPRCRSIRRGLWRNERHLYHRKCAALGHSETLISMYAPDDPVTVCDTKFWWGDAWDPMSYGRDYDFSRSFWEQFSELQKVVPRPPLVNNKAVDSDYCNFCDGNKNCYLVVNGNRNEDCAYTALTVDSKNVFDGLWCAKSEFAYECIDCDSCYHTAYAERCEACVESAFLFDCRGLTNCLFCVGLRNASYHAFNKPVAPEEYKRFLAELGGSYKKYVEAIAKFEEMKLRFPRRSNLFTGSKGVSGENILNSNAVKHGFDIFNSEHCAYVEEGLKGKDCYDTVYFDGAELCYESSSTIGYNYLFTLFCRDSKELQYCDNCHASSHLFGCVGLRSKQYCILNKQYSKEEYETLVPKIRAHMDEMPYVSQRANGKEQIIYKYGEFFPAELSPFAYNETVAQEFYPTTKDSAERQGFRWNAPDTKNYAITKAPEALPDSIGTADDALLGETIGCAHHGSCAHECTVAFRLIPHELQFYRRMNLPLPRLCPNCRYYGRLAKRNPLQFSRRACQCAGLKSENGIYANTGTHTHKDSPCPNEFETPYSPDRPEIVYCEECYKAEVF